MPCSPPSPSLTPLGAMGLDKGHIALVVVLLIILLTGEYFYRATQRCVRARKLAKASKSNLTRTISAVPRSASPCSPLTRLQSAHSRRSRESPVSLLPLHEIPMPENAVSRRDSAASPAASQSVVRDYGATPADRGDLERVYSVLSRDTYYTALEEQPLEEEATGVDREERRDRAD